MQRVSKNKIVYVVKDLNKTKTIKTLKEDFKK